MTQNGSDIVPTQNAVRGYVNRRLGWDHNGLPVNNVIGGGTLPRDGHAAMTGNLNMGSKKIINLLAPTQDSDGVNKAYVDNVAAGNSQFDNLRDTSIRKASVDSGFSDQFAYKGQLVHYSGDKILYINGGNITDGPFTTTFQDSIITSGTAIGWVRRVESITDPVEGAVINCLLYTSPSPRDRG